MFDLIGWIVCGAIFGIWQYRRRIGAANSTVGMAVPTRAQQAAHMVIVAATGSAMGAAVWGTLWLMSNLGH